jgi:hypothetical protein
MGSSPEVYPFYTTDRRELLTVVSHLEAHPIIQQEISEPPHVRASQNISSGEYASDLTG